MENTLDIETGSTTILHLKCQECGEREEKEEERRNLSRLASRHHKQVLGHIMEIISTTGKELDIEEKLAVEELILEEKLELMAKKIALMGKKLLLVRMCVKNY